MPTILTATDFTDVATNAVHYACNLAIAHNASITVLHSYFIPVAFNDTPMPVMSIDEAKEIAEEGMNGLIRQLKTQYPNLQVQTHISYGDITDSLQEYAEQAAPWLTVVGNSSSEDTAFWPGSNLMNALKELSHPVVAVPLEARYRPVKKICFACDYKNVSELLPASDLVALAKNTDAQLHVLNVHKSDRDFGTEAPPEAETLRGMLADAQPQYHFISSNEIDEGIQHFVVEQDMDWLVVMPHKHNFFDRLLHHSHTKAMARMSHIPLVSLHQREQ
jgi:nucleotide-binding universal stress UspA family protein